MVWQTLDANTLLVPFELPGQYFVTNNKENLDPGPGEIEYIIFNGPSGKIKLERTVKPAVLDKKGLGSKRIGSLTKVEYIYSDTDKVDIFKAYKWENDGWVEIEAEKDISSFVV